MDKKDELRQVIFCMLFQNEKAKLEELIHHASIEELGKMLIEKNWHVCQMGTSGTERAVSARRPRYANVYYQILYARSYEIGYQVGRGTREVAETRFRQSSKYL